MFDFSYVAFDVRDFISKVTEGFSKFELEVSEIDL